MTNEELMDKLANNYWICNDCARDLGGINLDWPLTFHKGECPFCDKEKSLCSVYDFEWPQLGG